MKQEERLTELLDTINKQQKWDGQGFAYIWETDLRIGEIENNGVKIACFVRERHGEPIILVDGTYSDREKACEVVYSSLIGTIINSSLSYLKSIKPSL